MDKNFIGERISELRLKKNVSEYQMSLDLGKKLKATSSPSLPGRSLPTMQSFLDICDYLEVTPQQFFDSELKPGPPKPGAARRGEGGPAGGAGAGTHGPCCTRTYCCRSCCRRHRRAGARAAGAHQVGDEPDDQQHRHNQQNKAHNIGPSSIGGAGIGIAAVQRYAIDAAQPVGQRLHGLLGAGVVITVDPIGFHVLVQQRPQRAERQLAFQPVAAHDVVVAAVGLVWGPAAAARRCPGRLSPAPRR